jgi:hypothetical protein
MHTRISTLFLLLILAQVTHVAEEYIGRLWEVYAPAIFICNLVSRDPHTGFLAINIVFLTISFLYWRSLTRKEIALPGLIWLWVVLETLNIGGHFAWSISRAAYTPGLVSAIYLLIILVLLVKAVLRNDSARTGRSAS